MQHPWRRLSGLPVTIAQVLCCFRKIDSKEAVSLAEIFVMGRAVTEQSRKMLHCVTCRGTLRVTTRAMCEDTKKDSVTELASSSQS